ncbi:dipeptidase [Thalassococcus sp. S3]|uniref:dipeptidase n=1 Tax=Thalassococcus sp. S3 TaxID=2017482 RepID=UPI00102408B9|nr:dipeptidase [Thalassococcus sp. S3]QBF32763.1 peptidase M19 [Thalassococcus sp. S3]
MTQMVFDGHNDVLTHLSQNGGRAAAGGFLTGLAGQLDAMRAQIGGFGGGFFATWAQSDLSLEALEAATRAETYDLPLPPAVPQAEAWTLIDAQADILWALDELGAVKVCQSLSEVRQAETAGQIAAIFQMEGAEAIGPDLSQLDQLYARGLRSLGLAWSRPTIFGDGVPFRFPSDGDIGSGLTEAGRSLVVRCNELGILIDLSHLNAAGVADVAEISDAPLVATHSNAHAICPHARNLTDAQLSLIAKSGGLVGLNFECTFLHPHGRPDPDTPAEVALQHLDHLIDRLGEEGVALGSDFDGCRPPNWIDSADKLPALVQAMEGHGYKAARIERICWENWMRILGETWREAPEDHAKG